MPVVTRFTRHYPFLLESDFLSLSRDFTVRDNCVLDIPLGAMHQLHSQGQPIIAALMQGCTQIDLEQIARRHSISITQLNEVLGFLNMMGGLQRRRNRLLAIKAWRLHFWSLLLGGRFKSLAWRREATLITVCLGTLRATWSVIAATAIVCLAAAVSGIVPVGLALTLGIHGLTLFGTSLVVHEMIHTAVARRNNLAAQVLQIDMQLGVLHRHLPFGAEIISAIGGPLAGSTLCLLVSGVALLAHAPWHAALGCAVAIFHALALLPWHGDGQTLWKTLRNKKLGI